MTGCLDTSTILHTLKIHHSLFPQREVMGRKKKRLTPQKIGMFYIYFEQKTKAENKKGKKRVSKPRGFLPTQELPSPFRGSFTEI